MQKEIKQAWFFKQSPEEVWEYLTKPELIEQWLMKTDFQPVIGHKFQFVCGCGHDNNTAIHCEVLEITPYTRLSYSWQTNSVKDDKPFNSKVIWTLIPKEKGTELQLVHNGFKVLEDLHIHNDGWTELGDKFVELLNVAKI